MVKQKKLLLVHFLTQLSWKHQKERVILSLIAIICSITNADWIILIGHNKNATNPINNEATFFQFVTTVPLNHEEIGKS